MSDKLIAFYSRADENYVSGALKTLEVGNTEVAANIIKEAYRCRYFQNRAGKAIFCGIQHLY